ncbi:MAG: RidA family protein [Flavobacteriaceae bacterium]|nr:RidA family protein [Flavobacteriaceae bacterium]
MKSISLLILLLFLSCNSQDQETTADEQLYTYDIEERISELNIELPLTIKPVANYLHAVKTGNLVFMAGKGPRTSEGTLVTGKLGIDLTVEQGYEAARWVAIAQLSALKEQIGDLNKVEQIVKVLGMVNSSSEFTDHPEVINGFSDVMVEVFGERGKHARAAVGMVSLPRNIACEIEMIVQVKD